MRESWWTFWCVTHEGQSETGKPKCLRLRARQRGRSVPIPNERRRCDIVEVRVVKHRHTPRSPGWSTIGVGR